MSARPQETANLRGLDDESREMVVDTIRQLRKRGMLASSLDPAE